MFVKLRRHQHNKHDITEKPTTVTKKTYYVMELFQKRKII